MYWVQSLRFFCTDVNKVYIRRNTPPLRRTKHTSVADWGHRGTTPPRSKWNAPRNGVCILHAWKFIILTKKFPIIENYAGLKYSMELLVFYREIFLGLADSIPVFIAYTLFSKNQFECFEFVYGKEIFFKSLEFK